MSNVHVTWCQICFWIVVGPLVITRCRDHGQAIVKRENGNNSELLGIEADRLMHE